MRTVVILDALRRDYAKKYLLPYFDAKFHEIKTEQSQTPTAFEEEIVPAIKNFPNYKAVVTGGGYAGSFFHDWKFTDYFYEKDKFPLYHWDETNKKIPDIPNDGLLVIHDYWIHNWFQELNMHPEITGGWAGFREEIKDMVLFYYKKRVLQMIKPLVQLRKKSDHFFITADHGESLYENGKVGHGPDSFTDAVSDIFIIDCQKFPDATRQSILEGK